MSAYQKVYMNQIHSSSLLCQLAHMWKSNLLCDAIIRTGPVITKAHRVVLVAACPMLQSMENASAGSHLEVRLAADIKQDSVNTFLQYLYEGFMMLTEENVREVEKIGRLLQVDSVTKCCVDFYKCLQGKTGAPVPGSSYKFSVNDTVEFRHVRATELQKTVQDRMMKRTTDFSRPGSPGNKRQRLQRNGSPDLSSFSGDKADDTVSMTNSYLAPDPWERVPRLGAGGNKSNKAPGVINMVEESIELVQTEPSEKETLNSQTHKTSVSLSVASQYNTEPNVSVVNVHQERDLPLTNSTPSHSARGSITVSPLTIFSENNNSENALSEQMRHESEVVFPERIKVTSTPRSSSHQNKPFAAGSANQASPGMIPKHMPRPPAMTSSRMESASPMDGEHRSSGANSQAEESPEDTSPDLSIVKVEKAEDIGLDMHIDVHDTGSMHLHKNRIMHSHDGDEGPDPSEQEMEDWAREEMSNEGSNVSGDQSNSWYMGTFKDTQTKAAITHTAHITAISQTPLLLNRPMTQDLSDSQGLITASPFRHEHLTGCSPSWDSNHGDPNRSLDTTVNAKISRSYGQWPTELIGTNYFSSVHHNGQGSEKQMTATGPGSDIHVPHRLVYTEAKKHKPCVYCLVNKVKTKSGWYAYTSHKCDQCDVPLCRGKRNCFNLFHQMYQVKSDKS